jgi:outer membrane protein OmpA-like peptidoglycan-associated protein
MSQETRSGRMFVVQSVPQDCLSLMPRALRSGIQDWRSLVSVEHCDRIRRLQRISESLPPDERPVFYDGSVLASALPPSIGIDIPILRVVFPDRVFFDTDSTVLKPAAMEVARIIAESLRHEPPDVVMFVAGHADARASRTYNAALSVDRANALAETVLDLGVNVGTVWRVGFGEDLPLVAGDSEWAYGQNRRIEFLFAARPEALAVWLSRDQVNETCQGRTRRETERCRSAMQIDEPVYVDVVPRRPRPIQVRPGHTRGGIVGPVATRGGVAGPAPTPNTRFDPAPLPPRISAPARTGGGRIDPIRAQRYRLDLRRGNYQGG